MSASAWTDADTARALQVWADYHRHHDVSSLLGQTVGIDPGSGQVRFGASAREIAARLLDQGAFRPLSFTEVGKDYYRRKGRRT